MINLNSVLEPIRGHYHLPALGAALVTSHGLSAIGAVGERKYGSGIPVTLNDLFHLGSCTKAMTATLMGILVEAGTLQWETTLAQIFEPDYEMLPIYRWITLEQLLSHQAAFPGGDEPWLPGKTHLEMYDLPGSIQQQRQAYLKQALQQPPTVPIGKYHYSNLGYTVAAAMAEQVMNASWEELITTKLFQPLGMTRVGFGPMGTPGQIDQPWQHFEENGEIEAIAPEPEHDNPPLISPAGRVHASLEDWGRFISLHLQGEQGYSTLLSPETLQKLHTPALETGSMVEGSSDLYGLGWMVTERDWGGGRVLYHNGSNTLNFALVWMAPQRDFAVLVATNQGGEQAFRGTDEAVGALLVEVG
ncbi:beta-lactamase family protein [Laspinema sp. A4]|uniref:serine hydrolase domain-containing protein n=1 Tax=Laspinema sp. D2d TaxID=2953686 RepID=UPI0021BA9EDC|nr:serine hydrolase domain-containing protein [Laspinema sp. D2d]MCT7985637.1 beta-lactamase family protein [Laspinema sp. D2d]